MQLIKPIKTLIPRHFLSRFICKKISRKFYTPIWIPKPCSGFLKLFLSILEPDFYLICLESTLIYVLDIVYSE